MIGSGEPFDFTGKFLEGLQVKRLVAFIYQPGPGLMPSSAHKCKKSIVYMKV
jgi:hypothetical protein